MSVRWRVADFDPNGPVTQPAYEFWYELADDGTVIRNLNAELEDEEAFPWLGERQLHQQPAASTVRLDELVREFLQLGWGLVCTVYVIGKCCLRIPRDHFNSIELRHGGSLSCGDYKRLDGSRDATPGAVSHGGES